MGFYRTTSLFIKGLRHDTKNGYVHAAKRFDESDLDVNLSGVSFLITGSNSGIGFETAKAIAKRGGIVHLVCRNLEKAKKAKAAIVEETLNTEIHVHILDMTQIRKVQEFVKKFVKEYGKLDVLINNAGEKCETFQKTKADNLERNFATNVMGPYVLTTGLIPILKKSPNNPRVVTVGSAGMLLHKLDVNYFEKNHQKFVGLMAYAQCKRQMNILMEVWAKEHPEINFSCMHPGWVDTPAARRGLGKFYEKMKEKFRSSEEGADTVIWLAISKKSLSFKNGSYFQDRKLANKHLPMARTKESMEDRKKLSQHLKKVADEVATRKNKAQRQSLMRVEKCF